MTVENATRSELVTFYKKGLGQKKSVTSENGWQMDTLSGFITELNDTEVSIRKMNIILRPIKRIIVENDVYVCFINILKDSYCSFQKIIDFLKIDIEYSEWNSLVPMLADNILRNVKQFGIEIHKSEMNKIATTLEQYEMQYKLLTGLEEQGFRKWKVHKNQRGLYNSNTGDRRTCCFEMAFININYIKKVKLR